MELGVSLGSYPFTAGFITPTELPSRKHELLGLPLRYHDHRPDEPIEWFIQRAGKYRKLNGVKCVSLQIPGDKLKDSAYIEGIADLLASAGIDVSHYLLSVNYEETPEEYVASGARFEKSVRYLRDQLLVAEKLGARAVKVEAMGRIAHRYRRDLPLAKQIERFGANLARVAEEASSFRSKVLIGNHAGYKVSDTIKVMKASKRDGPKIDFNVGNPFLAYEDPVSAAKEASPYVGAVTLKDLKVIATVYYGCRVLGVPLGRGSVELDEILSILGSASRGQHLAGLVETTPYDGTEDRAVKESLEFVNAKLKGHFRAKADKRDPRRAK